LQVKIIKKNKLEQKKKQNGGENQDGRQAYIFHSLVKFDANQLKLWI
jgi:hypothetical protein